MPKITIYENDYATLWYHTSKKIVHHVIHKPVFGAPLREGLEKGVQLLKENSAQKWLSDCLKGGAMLKDDLDWSQNEWYPRAVIAGWKWWAVVLPKKTVGQLSMKRMANSFTQPSFEVAFFLDPDEALSWLADQ